MAKNHISPAKRRNHFITTTKLALGNGQIVGTGCYAMVKKK